MIELSNNTKAILLLTAPLIVGRREFTEKPLTLTEYNRLARELRRVGREPADLLTDGLHAPCASAGIDGERVVSLLTRGFLLSQALERWQSKAIWTLSRADASYPLRLKRRLAEESPPIIYGCGNIRNLDAGGLAIVGSRNVREELLDWTRTVAQLAARAERPVVSGGARGVDLAAMTGSIDAGGLAVGVLADSLERAVLNRDNRNAILTNRLTLISPFDPSARFHVGNAMKRNKFIYALSDAALIVNSDLEKGGTWAGAVEQLDRMRLIPVYVRSTGTLTRGLEALERKGALRWPNPSNARELLETLTVPPNGGGQIPLFTSREPKYCTSEQSAYPTITKSGTRAPAEELFAKVREICSRMECEKTEAQVADELLISRTQAREWLRRLVDEGSLERLTGPVRYRSVVRR
ncbi:MAG: DNA-processing protein DprA [Vulcanimicrobiota bacterium]